MMFDEADDLALKRNELFRRRATNRETQNGTKIGRTLLQPRPVMRSNDKPQGIGLCISWKGIGLHNNLSCAGVKVEARKRSGARISNNCSVTTMNNRRAT